VAKLRHSLRFDLANALAGNSEFLTDLVEGLLNAIAKSETAANNTGFTRVK
jgi:hypothetical protein